MGSLNRLERALGRYAIPNLPLYFVMGQVAFWALSQPFLGNFDLERIALLPVAARQGEFWRLGSFLLLPPSSHPVFLAFVWYLFYLMGSALEGYWGVFRFNLFLLLGWVLTVAVAFLSPGSYTTNLFLGGSVFLAFAFLNPDFEMLIFFILPVKIKWLALLSVAVGAYQFVVGGLSVKLQIVGPVVTFILFFGADILRTIRHGQRTAARRAERAAEAAEPRHVCFVCGKSDLTHPQIDFRYCSKCAGDQCYCPEHIQNHAHVVAPDGQKAG